ncbi:hypothetical protein Daus18300_004393 [Diaporthe australafricana]|uniref:Thiamine-triphosphatase n=1 Tax=Diaporthe australafricana TaxID=127596 RepID=A0ABR3X9R8_9PEZI
MAPLSSRRLAASVGVLSIRSNRSFPSFVSRALSPSATQLASRLFGSQAFSPQPQRSILEVERKFAPTATSISQLEQNTGKPPFVSVVHKGNTCFEDTYYDTPEDTLSKAGIWIRRREKFECGVRRFIRDKRVDHYGASWEAKVRVGGDFINSAFKEITDVKEISAILSTMVAGSELEPCRGPHGGRVREMARFITDRTAYVVDGKFSVVVDVTDFGHTVGEVELERDATEARCEGEDKARAVAAMDRLIDEFMKRYTWAFPAGKPVGKLTAYFDQQTDRPLGH